MQSLTKKVAAFSQQIHSFSQHLSGGIEEIKRTAKSKPCIEPTTFREGYEELVQKTATTAEEISELESVTLDAISLEELLGHCLAQLEDNNKRVASLEAHLRDYGYKEEFVPFIRPPATQSLASEGDGQKPAASPVSTLSHLWDEPKRRRSYSSPGSLSDAVLGTLSNEGMRLATVTPSPILSSVPSVSSISPSLRDLQLKYGRLSVSGSPAPMQAADAAQQPGAAQSQEATPGGIPPSQAQAPPACATAQETKLVPTKVLTIKTARKQGSLADNDTGSARSTGAGASPMFKGDIIATRLASGEAPWDMLSLKAAINSAAPGTGQIDKAIGSATFHPQAAAFTSLLHMCAKHKLWEKALEVFEAMKRHHSAVVPNTVHFSSLISACGTAGRWQEAMKVFEEMKVHSMKDPQCSPNVITYSALMTACCAGGRPDKAHEVFLDMRARGVTPDHISYSTLIAGYERWGDMEKAKAIFEDMKLAGLPQKGNGPSCKVPAYLEQFNRKLQRTQSNLSVEDQPHHEKPRRGPDPSHRHWNSFASNATSTDSPYIGAHYGAASLSRGASVDLNAMDDDTMALRRDMLHTRSPSRTGFAESLPASGMAASRGAYQIPQTPVAWNQPATPSTSQLLQAARGGGHRGTFRANTPSPLSHSFDCSHAPSPAHLGSLMGPPPGFGRPSDIVQVNLLDHAREAGSFVGDLQPPIGPPDAQGTPSSLTFEAGALSQQLVKTPGIRMDVASQIFDAFVQQQQRTQATHQLPVLPQETFMPTPLPHFEAANGAPQISQVTVQEYNNLPLRFARQLSLDQMNDAVDYINAVVEGKGNSNKSVGPGADGVTPQELVPLDLGNQRTTALLNCLLQLKRVRLTVRDGQQNYLLHSAS